jgi:hypothetical protein
MVLKRKFISLSALLFMTLSWMAASSTGNVNAASLSDEQPTSIPTTLYSGPRQLPAGVLGLNGFPPEINPLTGLKAPNPDIMNRRPVFVKVSNYPRYSRPQAGLTYADMVFEYYIGEEANRFLALFYSQDVKKIGPVRSGRLVDAQLTNMYGGILGYGNADPKVDEVLIKELDQRAISFNDSGCPTICGLDTHSVAGVFADSSQLTGYTVRHNIDDTRPNLNGMLFENKAPSSNTFALNLSIEYSPRDVGEWRYNSATGEYQRWIESIGTGTPDDLIPLVDRLNNQQLSFANIIIIYARYIEYAPTLHEIQIWNNTDGQRALFFRDGIIQEGEWRAPLHTSPMQFYNQYGIPITLKPGNTWIVIAGLSSIFNQIQPGQWKLHFGL